MPSGPAIAMKNKIVLAKQRKSERALTGEDTRREFKARAPEDGKGEVESES